MDQVSLSEIRHHNISFHLMVKTTDKEVRDRHRFVTLLVPEVRLRRVLDFTVLTLIFVVNVVFIE